MGDLSLLGSAMDFQGCVDESLADEIQQVYRRRGRGRSDELLLGMVDDEFSTEAITVPLKADSVNITYSGRRGCGKSRHAAFVALDQLLGKFKHRAFIVDPAGEYRHHMVPESNPRLLRLWEGLGRFNLEPVGHENLYVYRPVPCMTTGDISYPHQLDTTDLTFYDLAIMMDLFSSKMSAARRRVRTALRRGWSDLGVSGNFRETTCPPVQAILDYLKKGTAGVNDIAIEYLENLVDEGAIGKTHGKVDSIKLLNQGMTPVLHTSNNVNLNKISAGYIIYEMENIIREREIFATSPKQSRLKFPVQFLIDEYNTIAPREGNKATTEVFNRIYDQMRKRSLGIVGVTPALHKISGTVLEQSDYIITSRIMSSTEFKVACSRLNPQQDPYVLRELVFDDSRVKQGHPPAEFAVIDSKGFIQRFFPLPSLSSHETPQAAGRRRRKKRVVEVDWEPEGEGQQVITPKVADDVVAVGGGVEQMPSAEPVVEPLVEPSAENRDVEEPPDDAGDTDDKKVEVEKPEAEPEKDAEEEAELDKVGKDEVEPMDMLRIINGEWTRGELRQLQWEVDNLTGVQKNLYHFLKKHSVCVKDIKPHPDASHFANPKLNISRYLTHLRNKCLVHYTRGKSGLRFYQAINVPEREEVVQASHNVD